MAKFKLVPSLWRCTTLVSAMGLWMIPPVLSETPFPDSNFNDSALTFIPLETGYRLANHSPSTPNHEPPETTIGGSRGNDICTIVPISEQGDDGVDSEIWNEKPTFMWKGGVEYVEVHSTETGALIWSHTVSDSKQSITYTGEALQPGKIYKLSLYDVSNPEPSYPPLEFLTFQVMEANQHQKIQQDLERLELELRQQKATLEAIALARVQYFVEQELWSDAMMESVSVPNQNQSLDELLKAKFPNFACG